MSLYRYDTTVDVSSSFNYFPLVTFMTFSCQVDLMEICISITTIGSAESLKGLVVVQDESQCRVLNCLCLRI
jgi:hypothetical protein